MRTRSLVLMLPIVLALSFSMGCGTVLKNLLTVTKDKNQVQVTLLAADTVDAANQLAELVLQMQASAHKLHQSRVLPVEVDNQVQQAAIGFADAKDKAVVAITIAQTPVQIAAAAAPLLGYAGSIVSTLTPVAGAKLAGTPGLLTGQLAGVISKARALIQQMGGKR